MRYSLRSAAPQVRDASVRCDLRGSTAQRAAYMHEAILNPTLTSEPAEGLEAAALRAQAWYGEPFLHAGEDPAVALAPGTARRGALDDALVEIEAGKRVPSSRWLVRYGLMLGLERVLASPKPQTAAGTDLRRHQIDALAGMLTELIAANQRRRGERQRRRRGRRERRGRAGRARGGGRRLRRGRDRGRARRGCLRRQRPGSRPPLPLPPSDRLRQDDRRCRLRRGRPRARHPHPHPPPPARLPVRARPHHRGLRGALHGSDRSRPRAAAPEPDHDPDLRLVRTARRRDLPQRLPARDLRRGAHRSGREDQCRDPLVQRAGLHRHDGDGAVDREAGLGRLPRLRRRPPARRRGTPRPDRTAALPAGSSRGGDQLRAHRGRRLRGARARRGPRPRGAQPGGGQPLPGPLRHHTGNRLRGRRRPRLQPRAGVPRHRPQGRGGVGPHASGQAGGDARRLRAGRDQRADQRAAARRGLELAPRHGLLPSRPDGVAARLPAAHRPHHAHAPAQGGRHRRRLRHRRGRRTTTASSRCTRCSTPTSTGRARASRPPRAAASSAGPAAGSRRRRGSCP